MVVARLASVWRTDVCIRHWHVYVLGHVHRISIICLSSYVLAAVSAYAIY